MLLASYLFFLLINLSIFWSTLGFIVFPFLRKLTPGEPHTFPGSAFSQLAGSKPLVCLPAYPAGAHRSPGLGGLEPPGRFTVGRRNTSVSAPLALNLTFSLWHLVAVVTWGLPNLTRALKLCLGLQGQFHSKFSVIVRVMGTFPAEVQGSFSSESL